MDLNNVHEISGVVNCRDFGAGYECEKHAFYVSTTFHNFFFKGNQWRIQDFPDEGPPTSKMGEPTYHLAIFSPENCMKMKEFGPRGGGAGGGVHPIQTVCPSHWIADTFLWPAFQRNGKVMFWHTSVCLSTGGEGFSPSSWWGGGVFPSYWKDVPPSSQWGSWQALPPSPSSWLGVHPPPIGTGWSTPPRPGTPPPSRAVRVLAMWRAVCLLPSPRRTF